MGHSKPTSTPPAFVYFYPYCHLKSTQPDHAMSQSPLVKLPKQNTQCHLSTTKHTIQSQPTTSSPSSSQTLGKLGHHPPRHFRQ